MSNASDMSNAAGKEFSLGNISQHPLLEICNESFSESLNSHQMRSL